VKRGERSGMSETMWEDRPEAFRVRGRTPQARIHVCLAAPTFHPYYSGAGERFRRYLRSFPEERFSFSVFSGTPQPAKARVAREAMGWCEHPVGSLLPRAEVDGIPVDRIRLPEGSGFRRAATFASGLARYCGRAESRPDVVQLFTPAVAAIPALQRIRSQGIPLVATQTMMPVVPDSWSARGLRKLATNLPWRLVDCGVVSSTEMLQECRRAGVHARLEVIPHGVDVARFRPPGSDEDRLQLRRELGLPSDARVLLFVGALTRRKGVDRLLEAWARLASEDHSLHLLLVGPGWDASLDGDEAFRRRLHEFARESSAEGRLHALGQVQQVELFMRAADLLVLLSNREGMPNVVLEAMASGLPVLMGPNSGVSSELGRPEREYFVSKGCGADVAGEIGHVLADEDGRRTVGLAARKWVTARLDMRRSVGQYATIYEELAGRARSRSVGRFRR
jgi:glycosyltransferase involved in cell wall biosynthesis